MVRYLRGGLHQTSTWWLRDQEKTRNPLNQHVPGALQSSKPRGKEPEQGGALMGSPSRSHAMSSVSSAACRSGTHGASPCSRRMIRVGWKNEILFIALKTGK